METNNDQKKLPPELEIMMYILIQNGMLPKNEKTYSKGKTLDDAIVINIRNDYVHQEYEIARYLFFGQGYWHYKRISQSLLRVNNRYYDKLVFEVMGDAGVKHEEPLFFDITVGYTGLRSH